MKKLIIFILISHIIVFAQNTQLLEYFKNSKNVMFLINPDNGQIIKSNLSASNFYGYTIEHLNSMKIQDINTFTPNQIKNEMKLAKEEKRNFFIFNHKLANGKIFKVHVHSELILYKNKKVLLSTISNFENFETIKQFNERLNKQVKLQIKELEKRKDFITKVFSIGFFLLIMIIFYLSYIFTQRKKLINSLELANKNLIENENLLKESNERFSLLYNNSPDMYISVSPSDAKVKLCNDTLLKKTGFSREEIIGKTVFNLYHKDCIEQVEKTFNEFKKTGSVKDKELIIKKKDGGKIVISLNANAIKNKKGKILYSMSSWRDITRNKKIEAELINKNKVIIAQSKQAAMGEMIGNIAHQWRQPLSVISSGVTGMMIQKSIGELDDEQFEKTCNLINKNTQYLSKTIDDFRDFIKGEKKLIEFDLKITIDNFLNLVKPSIQRHNLTMILNLEEQILLKGSPNELIQCFMNIFNNSKDAFQSNNTKENERYLFISQKTKNDNVIIKFKDNAGGIPKEIIEKIFEPYFTTKHQSQGTGIGLSMTYNLIETSMNGTIQVSNIKFSYNNKTYKGAEFTITLPLEYL